MPRFNLAKPPRVTPSIELLKEKPQNQQPIRWYVEPPSGGLVPIGDTGLYITPDEPADPRDCERYPDSIYCGAIPWTWTPIGLDPVIALDECNIGIKLTPILGWTILPPISFVYRRPECREPEEEPIIHKDVPLFAGRGWYSPYSQEGFTDYERDTAIYATKIVSVEQIPGAYYDDPFYNRHNSVYGVRGTLWKIKYLDCKGRERYWNNLSFGSPGSGEDKEPPQGVEIRVVREKIGATTFEALKRNQYPPNGRPYGLFGLAEPETESGADENDYPPVFLTFTDVLFVENYLTPYLNPPLEETEAEALSAGRNFPPSYCRPYYPPPLPPEKCCMKCCPPPDDSLLRLLMKKVDKLSSIVGVDDYPVSLPTSLISKDEGFLGNLIPNRNMDVPSLTRLFAWYIERFDEIMGQWEIPIEVKDSDPTKPGDQPVGFRLPNMAEAIAEMFGLMLQTSINTQIGINMQTRTMLEVGQNKQQGFKSYMLVLAIADHLGFDYKEVKHKIPMLFDITQTQLDKLLQESEIEVSAVDYTDKEDLKIVLLELRQAAAIIKAVHWRKFDLKSDVAKGVKDLIMGLVATSDEVNDSKKDEEDGKDKFDNFLEDVERGFTTSSGITDTDHPYGRNYNERPRIKEIGQESPGV